jgi:hypothetical protein
MIHPNGILEPGGSVLAWMSTRKWNIVLVDLHEEVAGARAEECELQAHHDNALIAFAHGVHVLGKKPSHPKICFLDQSLAFLNFAANSCNDCVTVLGLSYLQDGREAIRNSESPASSTRRKPPPDACDRMRNGRFAADSPHRQPGMSGPGPPSLGPLVMYLDQMCLDQMCLDEMTPWFDLEN